MELPDTSSRNEQSIKQYKTSLYSVIVSGNIVEAKGIIDEILSDDVPVTVSKRVLLSFAGDLGKFEAKDWKEIADYTLPMIEPRVVFKEQAEMITSKMNCLDGMRGSIDKDIEVSRGRPKKRLFEEISGSEERGSKGGPEMVVENFGKFARKDLSFSTNFIPYEGEPMDPSLLIEKFEVGNNLSRPNNFIPVHESMDKSVSVEKFEVFNDLSSPMKFEPFEKSLHASFTVEKFKVRNDLSCPVYMSSMPSNAEVEKLDFKDTLSRPEFLPVEGKVLKCPLKEQSNLSSDSNENLLEYEGGEAHDDTTTDNSEIEFYVLKKPNMYAERIRENMERLKNQLETPELPPNALKVKAMEPENIRSLILGMFTEGVESLFDDTVSVIHFRLPKVEAIFDPSLGFYFAQQRGFTNTNMMVAKKFWIFAELLHMIYQESLEDSQSSNPRNFWYMKKDLFRVEEIVRDALDTLCEKFMCTRASLRVYGPSKGKVFGHLEYSINNKPWINCTQNHTIPDEYEISELKFKTYHVRFVLIIEKETIFNKIKKSSFCDNYGCLLVTGKGMPDMSTRLFIRAIKEQLGLPGFVLVDCNPWGIKILSVYKHGSTAKAFYNDSMAVTNLRWIGLRPDEVEQYASPGSGQQLTAYDLGKCNSVLKESAIQNEVKWVEQLEMMKNNNVKYELESIPIETLLSEYLPSKLANEDWL